MLRGFSLVELSIVLVILGLLTGGILAGQSLIRASELRAVTTEYQRYMTAIQSFRDKYFALPGDMNNATRFWNREVNQAWCVTNSSASVATPGACDGNGDGLVLAAAAASQSGEVFQLWTHLANAGLVEGSYSGIAGAGGVLDGALGTNLPASKLGNAGWSLRYVGTYGDGAMYTLDYGTAFSFGAKTTGYDTVSPILKPEEAWNIDTKLDDGKPASGKVVARFWSNACAAADDGSSATTDLAASYRLTDTALQCTLYFVRQF